MLPLLLTKGLPGWKNALLALLSAVLLILAFPDFDYWFLAWFALAPLMWAVEREKESTSRSFVLGWIFGTAFFFGTCWWLTYAPITYAAFPPILAYFLLFCVCLVAGLFPAMFAGILSVLLRRFGSLSFLAAPFVWVFTEFLRYWVTGNNWNALGYSQAFAPVLPLTASIGGVLSLSCVCATVSAFICAVSITPREKGLIFLRKRWLPMLIVVIGISSLPPLGIYQILSSRKGSLRSSVITRLIAIQPSVPMSGLTYQKWQDLRRRHVRLAESALADMPVIPTWAEPYPQSVVVFPESPMNFMYETDPETRQFIDGFARKNNVSVLFNSAEPDEKNGKFFNSAVMVGPQGGEVAQYDKIYLLPFGEAVPFPLEGILPGFVGNFSYGREYDLLPIGDAKAGVMICFESHFGQLSREYVRNGADVIIEMTNDGYLGPTPVLRQHLANAVFRAVETNRPVLRVTNVGITAYINERGEVLDPAQPYTEDTRVWSVAKSDGSQTLYVRYGDWFAWLCSFVTIGLMGFAIRSRSPKATNL
ncbi:MAG: apolipoprotein N-acyltransferase [Pyrinomonadaceae bacterium]